MTDIEGLWTSSTCSGGVALRSAYGLPARNAAAPLSYTTPRDASVAPAGSCERQAIRPTLLQDQQRAQ